MYNSNIHMLYLFYILIITDIHRKGVTVLLTQSLDGNWCLYYAPERNGKPVTFCPEAVKSWEYIPAQVPGCVQLDLYNAGITPDPFYADNIHLYAPYEYYCCT